MKGNILPTDMNKSKSRQVDRRMAEMDLHRALYNGRIVTNLSHLTKRQEAYLSRVVSNMCRRGGRVCIARRSITG
jgi:hypothetical protein